MESLALAHSGSPGAGGNLVPLSEETARGIRPALVVLFTAAGCVLLIACANLANLMLAHTRMRVGDKGPFAMPSRRE